MLVHGLSKSYNFPWSRCFSSVIFNAVSTGTVVNNESTSEPTETSPFPQLACRIFSTKCKTTVFVFNTTVSGHRRREVRFTRISYKTVRAVPTGTRRFLSRYGRRPPEITGPVVGASRVKLRKQSRTVSPAGYLSLRGDLSSVPDRAMIYASPEGAPDPDDRAETRRRSRPFRPRVGVNGRGGDKTRWRLVGFRSPVAFGPRAITPSHVIVVLFSTANSPLVTRKSGGLGRSRYGIYSGGPSLVWERWEGTRRRRSALSVRRK